jgi:hypothetical protein
MKKTQKKTKFRRTDRQDPTNNERFPKACFAGVHVTARLIGQGGQRQFDKLWSYLKHNYWIASRGMTNNGYHIVATEEDIFLKGPCGNTEQLLNQLATLERELREAIEGQWQGEADVSLIVQHQGDWFQVSRYRHN